MFKNTKLIYIAIILLSTALYVTIATDQQRTISMNDITTEQIKQTSQNEYTSDNQNLNSDNSSAVNIGNDIKIYEHIVKSSSTIETIANTYKVTKDTIINSNDLSKDAQLKEGQILEFLSVTGVLYRIKDSETLWDLAILNNIDINRIIAINKIESPEKLKLGQKIIMPDIENKVTYSDWSDGYGNLVIISHGNGLKSYYARNSKLLVKQGEEVKKGTHIAEVGNTGNSTGPHSHFEVRKNNTPVNPYNYIN